MLGSAMPSDGSDSDFRRVLYGILHEVECADIDVVVVRKISNARQEYQSVLENNCAMKCLTGRLFDAGRM